MRLVIASLAAIAACTDSYHDLSIDPIGDPPLGIGLTQRYKVTQELCEGGIDGSCGNPVYVPDLAVTLDAMTVAELSAVHPFDGTPSSFDLTGVATGQVTVAASGRERTSLFTIDVAPVATTTLFVDRTYDAFFGPAFPDVRGPIRAFTGSRVRLGQHNVGADQSPRAGEAAVALDAGATGIAFDASCDCYRTGTALGTARLSTELASLDVGIVDATAIAAFTIDGRSSPTIELIDTLGTNELFLIPTDAAGTQIVGAGPEPTLAIADPGLVSRGGDIDRIGMRSFTLYTHAPGTTTLEVTWGGVHGTFTVHISP